ALGYTWGTTGPPRGAELTHAQMLAELAAANALMPAGPADRVVSYLPMAHAAERALGHYGTMLTGVQVTTVADAKALPGALTDARPTIFGGVPRGFGKLKAGVDGLVAWGPDPAQL